jgi:hypothetical protein
VARADTDDPKSLDDALNLNVVYLARAGFALVAAVLGLLMVHAVLRNPVGERAGVECES